jgi:hypothetical protein
VDPASHKRYLDYRERHAYFGRRLALMTMAEFVAAEKEYQELAARAAERDDDDEARFALLERLLLRD